MELRHLRYFVAVAAERGITRAAAKLNVSQPPLSRQIRDLEEELGVPLFDRSARQIQLTAAGRLFLKDAQAVLRRVEDATRRVRSLTDQATGEVRVGYAPSPTIELLPRVLKVFRKAHPKARVVLLDISTDEMVKGLKARALDVALVVRPPLKKDSGLKFEGLLQMPIGIVVSHDHPFAQKPSVTLEEALSQPLVAYIRKGYADYHHWLQGVIKYARCKPRITAQADGGASLMAAVQSGQGVAFGPPTFETVASGRVKFVSIVPAAPPIDLGFIVREGRNTAMVQAFAEALRVAAKTCPKSGRKARSAS